jgi:hypothetical protein
MRLLKITDLIVALLLLGCASAAARSADPLAVLGIPILVGAAVGAIVGRLRSYLAAGLIFVAAFIAFALCAGA